MANIYILFEFVVISSSLRNNLPINKKTISTPITPNDIYTSATIELPVPYPQSEPPQYIFAI